ncbi:MAG: primosomal protein N' [Bacteroidales bacterium]|jgi:primosomal protein N' (replication factor Y)|nr:primosomal protein N' [Bacteroidales bacterium]
MNTTSLFADVILPLPLRQLFTYSVSVSDKELVKKGKRVVVQFGNRKIYTAIIYRIHSNKPVKYKTKDILTVLDDYSVINDYQFSFWEWISSYYMCSIGEVYKAALPSGLKMESETKVIFNPNFDDFSLLNSNETLILEFLENNNMLKIQEVALAVQRKNVMPIIKLLLEKKAVFLEEKIKENYKPKTETYISLHENVNGEKQLNKVFESLKNAPKQLGILMNYIQLSGHFIKKESVEIRKSDLLNFSKASAQSLKSLLEKDILVEYANTISRIKTDASKINIAKALSSDQEKSYIEIKDQFTEKNTVLLHGVTSSGKTEIYIHLMMEQVKLGKQVLFLLPEIALTTQIISRLRSVFGNRVGVYHSKFSNSERVEIYNNLLGIDGNEKYDIILGVRSSLFLPFDNLGLIIIDEEHENTYKQYDPAPRYSARDSAIVLANFHNAKVLLGTATPSIESFSNARIGKYGFVELKKRYQNIKLPEIILADTHRARKKKQMKSIFTPLLFENIQNALDAGEQVILFQNRRGFSPFLECDTCGWIPKCKNCDVSLTYHKYEGTLVCHYCGYTEYNTHKCSACGNISLSYKGFGTEKIENEVKELFPETKVARMDFDSTRTKNSYEKIIEAFETGKTNILIGTQMISKGLDFDNVSTVGIMNADNMLNFPDFRAFERSYQLMAQVSGRAGRKYRQGKVIIQTSDPEHSILQFVLDNKYESMYNEQMIERKNFHYPPYYRIINLLLKHKKQDVVNNAASKLTANLQTIFGSRILGPESPYVGRVQNHYLKKIMIKIEKDKSIKKSKVLLQQQIDKISGIDNFKSLQINIDVDPM